MSERGEINELVDDYETALNKLWGAPTLKQLRKFINDGVIKAHHVKRMTSASRMDVLPVYNQNIHNDLSITFEEILDAWFKKKLFNFQPSEAKTELVRVLGESMCDPIVIDSIERLTKM